jgi:hypothetical protein
LEPANGKRDIDGQRLADFEDQAPALEALEARQLGDEPITARDQLRGEVAAIRAARDFAEDARLFIGENDVGTRQNAALLVGDASADFRCALLREKRRGRTEHHHREKPAN